MRPTIVPLGDSALLVRLGNEIDLEINQCVHALDALLRADAVEGVIETVPAYATLLVHYDPLVVTYEKLSDWANAAADRAESTATRRPRQIEVPVRYGGASGPDLEWVAAHQRLSIADVIHLHASQRCTVYMMGFTPGFPYMGKLHPLLVTPRLDTPRTLVRAGSVAIAGEQTGIYPVDSPGGWRLIGWTPLHLFDPASNMPFLFAPGDEVRFAIEAIDA
ncbi:MAG TPA: 5-oxoprolinase subunit PxpB [Anaerolineales bacterium]|nr:5-oxoprolinase subunit PxpB [Anaerolineales bacterium]